MPKRPPKLYANDLRRKPPKKTTKKAPRRRKPIWGFLLKSFLFLAIWGTIFFGFTMVWFTYDLPNIGKLQMAVRKPSVTVQSQDGKIIGTYGDLYEDMIRVQDLPPYVPQAFLAIEDRRFYSHFGVDMIGIVRAAYTNYRADRVVQGGSSITQQLAKNFLITQGLFVQNDRSLRRKIQEALMAVWLEWHFSKDQILTIYLNRVYFGAGTFGIDAASRKYFGKSAKQLSVLEAAIIAGLLKAPSRYSPAYHPQRAIDRAKIVLQQMVEAGFLQNTQNYMQESGAVIANKEAGGNQSLRFFTDWIYETVPNYISVDDQDLVVITTLDPFIQEKAERVGLAKFSEMAKDLRTTEIGIVLLTTDGAIKAMVGGVDYTQNQYNHVAVAKRQPGSAFKIFIYLAALESGLSPETLVGDTPFSIGKWSPKNFRTYHPQGEITLEQAFAKSVNASTIRFAQHVGPKKIAALAHRLGITSDISHDLSIALGTCETTLLELTSAFATIANNGKGVWPYGILEIRDKEGHVLYRRQETSTKSLIAPLHLQQIRRLLTAVVTSGTGRAAQIGVPIAGKTGSNADRDAWFIGYVVGGLVGGVWTGNDDGKPMQKKSTGGNLPARVWSEIMKEIIKDLPPQPVHFNTVEEAENEVAERLTDFQGDDDGSNLPAAPAESFENIIDSVSNGD
ncbi:MAG: PBP1A family penicillin-binding protein [Alphaproteobacteria bacterium]